MEVREDRVEEICRNQQQINECLLFERCCTGH